MLVIQFVAGFLSSIGFGYLFNCPKKAIVKAAMAGAFGWISYAYCVEVLNESAVFGTFIGTLVLSVICEILARVQKDAVTVFVIPAILPLVPGAGLYYTMRYFIEGQIPLAIDKGLTTLGCALGIAVGIIVVSSISKIVMSVKRGAKRVGM